MFAIRCNRVAVGATVDGVDYAHTEWTLQYSISEVQRKECGIVAPFSTPLLVCVEVNGPDDPALLPFRVANTIATEKTATVKENAPNNKSNKKSTAPEAAFVTEAENATEDQAE